MKVSKAQPHATAKGRGIGEIESFSEDPSDDLAGPVSVTDWQTFRAAMERDLAAILAPDLQREGATTVYVTSAAEAGIRGDGAWFNAMTSPVFAQAYREAIGDRWQGNGPGLMLVASDFDGLPSDDPMQLYAAVTNAVARTIHEVAHIATFPAMFYPEAFTSQNDIAVKVRAANDRRNHEIDHDEAVYQVLTHDPAWITAALHASYRLDLKGWNCRPQLAWPNEISRPERYAEILGDEPQRLREVPLTVIGRCDPPASIAQLWAADIKHWTDRITEPNKQKESDMTSLLSKVEELASARQAERITNYRALVIEVANGGEPDPDATVDILEAAGKSPLDLSNDVATVNRRRALLAEVAAGESATTERVNVLQQIEDANEVLRLAQQAHRETTIPLAVEAERLANVTRVGKEAAQTLTNTARGPLKESHESAVHAVSYQQHGVDRLYKDALALSQQIERTQSYIDSNSARGVDSHQLQDARSRLERLQGEKETADAKLASVQSALNEAQQAEEQARALLSTAEAF